MNIFWQSSSLMQVQERKVLRTPPSVMGADNVCLVGEKSGKIKWIQPSGMSFS